jgi:hypothetical protein
MQLGNCLDFRKKLKHFYVYVFYLDKLVYDKSIYYLCIVCYVNMALFSIGCVRLRLMKITTL